MKIEWNKRKFNEDNNAVVGIIVTVLLIGLFLSVLVMLNTVYVPQWLEESEAAHMEDISNQFAQLKYALDIQSMVNDSTAMSTSVTLGTKEIPFFDRGRTFDTLQIVDDDISIIFDGTFGTETYTSDTIQFNSGNSFFVDQTYTYEAGALIISQGDASVLYGKPSVLLRDYGENMSFVFTKIQGVSGKTEVSGYGNYPVYTECITPLEDYTLLEGVTDMTIETSHPQAWKVSMQNALRYSGLNYTISTDSDNVYVEFTYSGAPYYTFYIREVDVNTQISFGLAD